MNTDNVLGTCFIAGSFRFMQTPGFLTAQNSSSEKMTDNGACLNFKSQIALQKEKQKNKQVNSRQ